MTRWRYQDPSGDYTLTEEEILDSYYAYWCQQMLRVGKLLMVSPSRCIIDWATVHYAWEV